MNLAEVRKRELEHEIQGLKSFLNEKERILTRVRSLERKLGFG